MGSYWWTDYHCITCNIGEIFGEEAHHFKTTINQFDIVDYIHGGVVCIYAFIMRRVHGLPDRFCEL